MRFSALVILALAATLLSLAAQPNGSSSKNIIHRAPAKQSARSQPAAPPKHPELAQQRTAKPPEHPELVEGRDGGGKPGKHAPTSFVLLYTASADGQIRSCNCTKFRFGGYGRELTLLDSIRPKVPDCLLIEGGDVCGDTGFQAELKAKVSAQALDLLGYGLIVPGEKELGVRGVRYTDQFKTKTAPLLCANVFGAGESKPRFRPYIILKTSGGLRVAVIGLVARSVCEPWLQTSFGEVVKEPSHVLPPIIKQLRPKADLVVVVYHGIVTPTSDLARVSGIDLILATHRHNQDRLFPSKESNIVSAPVGKLGSAVLINSETSTNWCLGRVDVQLGPGKKIKSAKHELFYLDRSYEEAPAMVKIYDIYNEDVKNAVIASSAAFKKQAEAMLTKRGLNLVQMRQRLRKSTYATSAKCADCHSEISAIYADSRHAHAMATLEKTHQEFDPECIRCHTTGSMTRGGFTNAKDTPELGNVQCEACHGPAADHVAAPAKGFGKVTEETCRSCHTDERTPDFDYAAAWAKIMH